MRYRQQRTVIVRLGLFIGLFLSLLIGPALLMKYYYFERICQVYAQAQHFEGSRYSAGGRHSPETCFFESQNPVLVKQIVGWNHQVIRVLWGLYLPLGPLGLTVGIFLAPWEKLKWFKNSRL
ncbi:hypothetical protein [Herpetosiphon gulosus]|uniref:DUF3592 domain-containing protein n=1 Tax=Herpetosiphon gulosus TaxID=1973496 RepID=A0ABP9WTI6_9CHLR